MDITFRDELESVSPEYASYCPFGRTVFVPYTFDDNGNYDHWTEYEMGVVYDSWRQAYNAIRPDDIVYYRMSKVRDDILSFFNIRSHDTDWFNELKMAFATDIPTPPYFFRLWGVKRENKTIVEIGKFAGFDEIEHAFGILLNNDFGYSHVGVSFVTWEAVNVDCDDSGD